MNKKERKIEEREDRFITILGILGRYALLGFFITLSIPFIIIISPFILIAFLITNLIPK